MEYARPNYEMLRELSSLYLYWYLPKQALYGWSVELALEYQKRQDSIRTKYESIGT